MANAHIRWVLLISAIAVLVALAGCGDAFSGSGRNINDDTDASNDTVESDNESDDSDQDEADNAETDDSDDEGDDTNETETDDAEQNDSDQDDADGDPDNEEETNDDDESNDTDAGDRDEKDDARDDDNTSEDDQNGTSDDTEPDTPPLTLTVVDTDGDPIEGATVAGQGEPHEADIPLEFGGKTDADGLYTDVIYENEYTIDIDHPDYNATTVEHPHDGESNVTVELKPATSSEQYEVTFTVLDSETGDPINGATVAGKAPMRDSGDDLFVGETGPNGTVTVEGNEGDWWDLEVRADGYETTAPELDTVDEDTSVTVELDPTSENDVNVEIVDQHGFVTQTDGIVDAERSAATDGD